MEKPVIECINTQVTSDGLHYGKFVAEPLERGYGITLGNSLRRVLLSDLEGTAITAVKIEGVPHEFSTVAGIVEDVIDIILNLKGLVLRSYSNESKTLKLSVNKGGAITGADIVTDAEVEVVNPNWYIATLNEGGSFEMELMIEKGKGFIPAEKPRPAQLPIGWIPIDAIYMPVRKVNYLVEDTRVGQVTDFDRLVIEVWTNGSIDPTRAISSSAMILINKFKDFVALAGDIVVVPDEAEEEETKSKSKDNDLSIEELELSVRAYNCLKRANIFSLTDLLKKTERELMEIKNFGRKSAEEVIDRVKAMGYQLKPGGPRSNLRDDFE
ncbi:MAG: DNA-directed RNA polymerase subunit alpha [Candidatus Sericytochromatia bacterium]|nr:DNA-directed RNA polymerase subunit alpha [Candidatus Sericytochromatia bacterium]